MPKTLERSKKFEGVKGPLVCVVMDGIGLAPAGEGNAVSLARTPNLDRLYNNYPMRPLNAHGTAVGMPSDEDMGNSEVGHNALGSGQVYAQGAKLVGEAIESGAMFDGGCWKLLVSNAIKKDTTLHFIGLLSDANVHSNLNHLYVMLRRAKTDGARRVRVHILTDGRDVGAFTALEYVEPFEKFLAELRSADFDIRIASGGGRMYVTMDRYEADWSIVERGWRTHVLGEGRQFASAAQAITTLREETRKNDQFLPPFVIAEDGKPVGAMEDGDGVILFNFRGDRAIEISKAFEDKNFDKFDRVRVPDVLYAGILEYDGDLKIPSRFLVPPPEITNTMGEYFAGTGITQYAVSETQKFGHVTYFWNGNRSGKYDETTETYEEIRSDLVPFEQRPWMKCADITDKIIEAITSGKYRFIRANFPNGDMVGHTGSIPATVIAVEALDLCLARILAAVDAAGGAAIITADHGNADKMLDINSKTGLPEKDEDGALKSWTAHTLSKVPCVIYDNHSAGKYTVKAGEGFGLSCVAATAARLLGYEPAPMWDEGLVENS